METAIQTISVLPETKQQSKAFAEMLTNEILSGYINPLEADLRLKIIIDTLDNVRDNIKKEALKEAEKHGEKFQFKGFDVTVTGKKTWDYKHIKSWVEQKAKLTEIEESAKNAYANTLKNIESFNSENGEQIIPATCKFSPYLKIE